MRELIENRRGIGERREEERGGRTHSMARETRSMVSEGAAGSEERVSVSHILCSLPSLCLQIHACIHVRACSINMRAVKSHIP